MRIALAIAVLALVGVAAAMPASAAGAEWTHEGEPLSESAADELTGTVGFASLLGSIECPASIALTLEPPDGGQVTEFSLAEGECTASGALEGCIIKNVEFTDLPLRISLGVSWPPISISGPTVHFEFDTECIVQAATFVFESTKAFVEEAYALIKAFLSGLGVMEVLGLELEAEVFGTLQFASEGTYGIE